MRIGPSETCHRAMRVLAEAPATMGEMREALGLKGKAAYKFQWPVTAMVEAGLICSHHGVYRLRDDGRDALDELDAGREIICHERALPSVRVFVQRAA